VSQIWYFLIRKMLDIDSYLLATLYNFIIYLSLLQYKIMLIFCRSNNAYMGLKLHEIFD